MEMDRGGVLTYGKRRLMCVLSILKKLPAHLNKLISLSFLPFSIQKKVDSDKIVQCESTRPIWCQNDVISTSVRNHVASTLIRRHFHVMCPLGLFMHNMGEIEGHQLLSE